MSNSYNISVKPEIAALEVKVDTIDTEVDAIRAEDVLNIRIDINNNETKIDAIDAVVDLIRGTDVTNIQTNIDANETKIDTNKGILDDILEDTAALPQNVRGKLYKAQLSTTESTFQTVCSVSGHGKLFKLCFSLGSADDTLEVVITLDGNLYNGLTHTGDTDDHNVIQRGYAAGNTFDLWTVEELLNDINLFNVEFESSLLVQVRRFAGTTSVVFCKAFYTLDSF